MLRLPACMGTAGNACINMRCLQSITETTERISIKFSTKNDQIKKDSMGLTYRMQLGMRNSYKILDARPEGKRPFGVPWLNGKVTLR
jgi:hypothetical protein